MNSLVHQKIKQTVEILNEQDTDLWLIFARESSTNHDPSMDMVVGANCTWQSAFLINKNGDTTAIVGSLEVPNMKSVGTYKNVVGYLKTVKEPLLEYLNKHNPKTIALNYSVNANLADGLTHGMYLNLLEHLNGTDFVNRFVSSEKIVSALRGRKSAGEVENIKKAIVITETIYSELTGYIKPGMTEKDVAAFILKRIAEYGLETAWEQDHCPAVYTGPETAGAHSGPTDRVIERGHIINTDFGVKVNGYCSDMQRTWYILREGETEAPAEVQRGFKVIKESIRLAFDAMKPGVPGCEIDDKARNHITSNGYDEYQHGLGHQVGRAVHDGGAGLFPRWERYGNTPYLPLEQGHVFTIEPRLFVKNHGVATVEEMVNVTADGCIWLTNPQEELWIIK